MQDSGFGFGDFDSCSQITKFIDLLSSFQLVITMYYKLFNVFQT